MPHTIMRQALLACIFLCSFSIRGSAQDSVIHGSLLTYTQQFDSVFQNMDSTLVPYGALYDRVFPFAALNDTSVSDSIEFKYFVQAYSEINRASYSYTHVDSIFDHTDLRPFAWGKNDADSIPILIIDANFASIDSNAFRDGRIDSIGGMYQPGNSAAGPYITHNIKIACLGVDRVLDSAKTYYLYFDSYLKFGNGTDAVDSIVLTNLETNQQYRIHTDHMAVPLNFSHVGDAFYQIGVWYASGTKDLTNIKLKINNIKKDVCESYIQAFLTSSSYQGYEESIPYKGAGEIKKYYARQTANTCLGYLTKPVIILDGFDALDGRDITAIYKNNLQYKDNGPLNLGETLRDLGYDIVILNFPKQQIGQKLKVISASPLTFAVVPIYLDGGTDYIERNAMVLMKVINDVNAELTAHSSTEKLVIIGPSMGGQISRYALKYMEDNSQNHNTRLWISFDSPHHGANIPLGFQYMLRHFAYNLESEDAKHSYETNIRSTAARQLLIQQSVPPYLFFSSNPYVQTQHLYANNEEPLRLAWRNTLSSIGYPNNLRKICISNGKASGGTYYGGGQPMFLVVGKTIGQNMTALMSTPSFMGSYGTEIANAWKFGKGMYYKEYSKNFLTYGTLDGYNGGMFDVQQDFYTQANNTTVNPSWPVGFVNIKVENMTHNMCFIPTPSALGVYDPNFNWVNAINPMDILCNNDSPFDNIYTPHDNQGHTDIYWHNAQFAIDEIQTSNWGGPCPKSCVYGITGPSSFTAISTANYTLDGFVHPSATITWHTGSSPSNLNIIGSTNNTTVTVGSITASSNNKLLAFVDNVCAADMFFEKYIDVLPLRPAGDDDGNGSLAAQYGNLQNKIDGRDLQHMQGQAMEFVISIYPNPATSKWNIEINSKHKTIFAALYDLMGRKVWDMKGSNPGVFTIDNRALATGTYVLKLTIDGELRSYNLNKE